MPEDVRGDSSPAPFDRRKEAARATTGVATVAAAQVLSTLLSLVLALIVPRLLGAGDYGNWALFRSVIDFMSLLCVLGSPVILARYYVEALTRGDRTEAGLIFKAVAVTRLVAGLAAAAAGCLLIATNPSEAMDLRAGLFLAWSIMARVVGVTFVMLLYAEQRTNRVAVVNVLTAVLVPAFIALAYVRGGFRLVPPACALGDTVFAVACCLLGRRLVLWPRGWLPRRLWKEITSFGLATAVAMTASSVYVTMAPYFMSLVRMDSVYIGYVGLAVRLQGILLGVLGTAGGALWPSVTIVLETEGIERSVVWQSLFSRLGAVLIMAAAGIFLVVADWAVPLVWGADFAPAVPVIALWFAVTLAFWIGIRYMLVGLLMKKPSVAVWSTAWMFGVFAPALAVLGKRGDGLGMVGAMLIGVLACIVSSTVLVRRYWGVSLQSSRLVLPLIATAALLLVRPWLSAPAAAALALPLWAVVFVAAVFVSRSLQGYEVKEILQILRRPARAGGPPGPAAR